MIETELLTPKGVQDFLHIKGSTYKKLARQPGFPRLQLPGVRRSLVSRAALVEWLAASQPKAKRL